ncbi:MAG TPA: Dabb family protein [Prosthecobacter sp.]
MPHFLIIRLLVLTWALFLVSSCTVHQQKGELQQVGLVWLKKPGSQQDQRKVIQAVHAFGRDIPEVKRALVGRTDGIGGPYSDTSYDLCFILSFEDEAARQRYNKHPVHLKAAQEVFLPLSRKLMFYRFNGE